MKSQQSLDHLHRATSFFALEALQQDCTLVQDPRRPHLLIVGQGENGCVVEFEACKTLSAARKLGCREEPPLAFLKLPHYLVRVAPYSGQGPLRMVVDAALLKQLPLNSDDKVAFEEFATV